MLDELNKLEKLKEIPKVIYSTHSDQKIVNICLKSGAKAYFQKSNTMGGIMQDIDNILKYVPAN